MGINYINNNGGCEDGWPVRKMERTRKVAVD